MKANLIVQINEITIRDYTLIEDEGIGNVVDSRPELSSSYEDDEESSTKYVIVIKGSKTEDLLSFLSFVEIPVKIIV